MLGPFDPKAIKTAHAIVQLGFADMSVTEQEQVLSAAKMSHSTQLKALVYFFAGYQCIGNAVLFEKLMCRGLQQLGYKVIFEI